MSRRPLLFACLLAVLGSSIATSCGEPNEPGSGNGEPCGVGVEGVDEDEDSYKNCDSIEELIDCDDTNADIHPGADEVCDGADTDCNGTEDDVDLDGDGVISSECGGSDCDDTNPNVFPGRPESCDGADNDCDDEIDDGFDADDDGWTSCNGDCDNTDPQINPDAPEVCDGVDNNCEGRVDETFDLDDDGYVGWDGPAYITCADVYAPGGERAAFGDCDDSDADQWPGAHEDAENGEDDDCDGCTDECQDADSDGWDNCPIDHPGDPTCTVPGESFPDDGLEADCFDCGNEDNLLCDQLAENVHPDTLFEIFTQEGSLFMEELCDREDNDCDGVIDEGYDQETCDPLP